MRLRRGALVAAVSFKKHPESTGKVGTVGFCFGGLMVTGLPLRARIAPASYYGRYLTPRCRTSSAPLLLLRGE
jgi:dienelactone hydrolase